MLWSLQGAVLYGHDGKILTFHLLDVSAVLHVSLLLFALNTVIIAQIYSFVMLPYSF